MIGLILIATFTNGFDLHLVWFIMALAQLTIILFSLLVLPIELDASRRAMDWMKGTELNRTDQLSKMSDAMKWASFTYLIMALTAIVHLLNYFNFFQASSKQK
jgi:Zn-dependent membrane protease YugP